VIESEMARFQQKLDQWDAQDAGFRKSMEDYYGPHSSIEFADGIVLVTMQDRWIFVNRDLQSRAKLVALVYLEWHPRSDAVRVAIKDFKSSAFTVLQRNEYSSDQALRDEYARTRAEAGLDRKPFNNLQWAEGK
jgi:hypothetical protein